MNQQEEIEKLKNIIDKQHQELQYFKEQFKILNDKLNDKDRKEDNIEPVKVSNKYWWKEDRDVFDRINKYINRSKKNMTQDPDSWLRINMYQAYPVSRRVQLTDKDKKRIIKYIVNELK
tara:strand:+ start:3560 stop:3916 length:357 start_codon:yes stop_codon:yes gene_type:complete